MKIKRGDAIFLKVQLEIDGNIITPDTTYFAPESTDEGTRGGYIMFYFDTVQKKISVVRDADGNSVVDSDVSSSYCSYNSSSKTWTIWINQNETAGFKQPYIYMDARVRYRNGPVRGVEPVRIEVIPSNDSSTLPMPGSDTE